ncbi:lipopolysaccharide transport periplasmic protein LptA [Solemya velesiana gill symbiont]|uniref:Lipopolysaccharide export system protein LptA n=1 Tax=Solemya velesiana gill symbiont TaxID=1918948 RepID=A0A1T2KVB0_9GAMM|nr:lipopolysaccharide transport periplasmic protein LptA [Solemya velesiana gill symbiont]OOZ36787.1 lipopolysaccharide transport periplasmic protein LptA [Solemya velesiana gill symbiont]
MKPTTKHYKTGAYWVLLTLLLALPGLSSALESDKDQPIYIESDSVDFDDEKGVAVYKGNVELTQGSIRVTASSITVTQSKDKDSDHILAAGNPVTYKQESDGDKGTIRAQMKRMEYDSNSEILHMIGDAVLSQGKDTFKSDRINYDRTKAMIKAGASAKGKQRVRVTIQSNKKKKNK